MSLRVVPPAPLDAAELSHWARVVASLVALVHWCVQNGDPHGWCVAGRLENRLRWLERRGVAP